MKTIRILIGGSPCTYWSIAQKNGRETEAKGLGWELFKNYLVAKEKFKPDFFLYENNKSAAQAIKDQIKRELKVYDGTLFMEDSGSRYIEINSALVSAQNRQRFYVHNCGEVEQPKDRGILLKDILETTVAESINTGENGKSHTLKAQYFKNGIANFISNDGFNATAVAEPVSVRLRGRQGMAKYEARDDYKSGAITAERIIEVAEPVNITADGKAQCLRATYYKDGIRNMVANDIDRRTCVAEPIRVGGGMGGKTGLYAVPCENAGECAMFAHPHGWNEGMITYDKAQTLTTGSSTRQQNVLIQNYDEAEGIIKGEKPKAFINKVYEVKEGQITIKGKQYPIKLADGYYIIRKLTVTECERLQTMPDGYTSKSGVSASQCYKGLGNGWTAEVIKHILSNALKDIPKDEEIVVLSMYDGIGTGRYCLDKMGFTNVKYYAYEIDKYAMQIAKHNYPDIKEMGDAFAVNHPDWTIGY